MCIRDRSYDLEFWAINAAYVQGSLGQENKLSRTYPLELGNRDGYARNTALGFFVLPIPETRKITLGYAHKIATASTSNVRLSNSWVYLDALIFWIK